jgi:hypothetical protein
MSTTMQLHPMIAPVLPSAASAMALVSGTPGALPLVIGHTCMRAGIISVGLLLSGQRGGIVRTALVSSLAIEAFVLAWAALARGAGGVASPAGPLPGLVMP